MKKKIKIKCDMWHMTSDKWHMTHYRWHMTFPLIYHQEDPHHRGSKISNPSVRLFFKPFEVPYSSQKLELPCLHGSIDATTLNLTPLEFNTSWIQCTLDSRTLVFNNPCIKQSSSSNSLKFNKPWTQKSMDSKILGFINLWI